MINLAHAGLQQTWQESQLRYWAGISGNQWLYISRWGTRFHHWSRRGVKIHRVAIWGSEPCKCCAFAQLIFLWAQKDDGPIGASCRQERKASCFVCPNFMLSFCVTIGKWHKIAGYQATSKRMWRPLSILTTRVVWSQLNCFLSNVEQVVINGSWQRKWDIVAQQYTELNVWKRPEEALVKLMPNTRPSRSWRGFLHFWVFHPSILLGLIQISDSYSKAFDWYTV